MPKQKTKKAAAKRFKRTANGRIKFKHAGSGHLLSSKSTKRKRALRARGVLSAPEEKRVSRLLG